MKSFTIITCLLAGAVVGILSDFEELSPDALDCLEEYHPLYKQTMKHNDNCDQKFPRPPQNFNKYGIDVALDSRREDRWQCYEEISTPEFLTKLKDSQERCKDAFHNSTVAQNNKARKLLGQDEWSRG